MSNTSSSSAGWLDRNGGRAFPLDDDSPAVSWNQPGRCVPDWLIRDARFTVVTESRDLVPVPDCSRLLGFWYRPEGGSGVRVRVHVCVSFAPGDPADLYRENGHPGLAVFAFEEVVEIVATSVVRGTETSGGAAVSAMLVLGAPSSMADASGGPHEMVLFNDLGGVPFLASRNAVVPGGIGVSSIRSGGVEATGVVHVADGVNTSFRIENGRLRLSAGRGLGIRQDCWGPETGDTCEFIRFINGQRPGTDGSFQIVGGEGITVVNGLTWKGNPAIAVVADFEASRNSEYVNAGVASRERE